MIACKRKCPQCAKKGGGGGGGKGGGAGGGKGGGGGPHGDGDGDGGGGRAEAPDDDGNGRADAEPTPNGGDGIGGLNGAIGGGGVTDPSAPVPGLPGAPSPGFGLPGGEFARCPKEDPSVQGNELLLAARTANLERVRSLLQSGGPGIASRLNTPEPPARRTALACAIEAGSDRDSAAAASAVVELLLDAGADPNLQDGDGNTALALAADQGNVAVVEALLRERPGKPGVKPNLARNAGLTPLHIALLKLNEQSSDERLRIVELIIRHRGRDAEHSTDVNLASPIAPTITALKLAVTQVQAKAGRPDEKRRALAAVAALVAAGARLNGIDPEDPQFRSEPELQRLLREAARAPGAPAPPPGATVSAPPPGATVPSGGPGAAPDFVFPPTRVPPPPGTAPAVDLRLLLRPSVPPTTTGTPGP